MITVGLKKAVRPSKITCTVFLTLFLLLLACQASASATLGTCEASSIGSAGSCSDLPSVVSVILPAEAHHKQGSAHQTSQLITTLSSFTQSFIVITANESKIEPAAGSQGAVAAAVPLLAHNILWSDDAAAAVNEAAKEAEASGAVWLFVAAVGDTIQVENGASILQQLKSAPGRMLYCHERFEQWQAQACFFKLPLQGSRFLGPIHPPVFIPAPAAVPTTAAASSKPAGPAGTAAVEIPTPMSMNDITLTPPKHDKAALKARVEVLREYLATNPEHKPWWHLQLGQVLAAIGWMSEQAADKFQHCYDSSTSRHLSTWAMKELGELRLKNGEYSAAIAAVGQGLSKETVPELLWIASFATYQVARYKRSVGWAEAAASMGCLDEASFKGPCMLEQYNAFIDLETWYEKPYDILRFAYRMQENHTAADAAAAKHDAALELRLQRADEGGDRLVVSGLQRLVHMPKEDRCEPYMPPSKPRIAGSITTAHRPEFFKRAWHSFHANCLDCEKYVDRWYAVDDGSTAEALNFMQKVAPPCSVTWLNKDASKKGHAGSLNCILDEVIEAGYEYLLHLEDDWLFVKEEEFVKKALKVMNADSKIIQVMFNKHYLETDTSWEAEAMRAPVDDLFATVDGQVYYQHVWGGKWASSELQEFAKERGLVVDMFINFHRAGFSLIPGLWRISAIQELGKFTQKAGFEEAFAVKAHEAGWKTAFLPDVYSIHLAPTLRMPAIAEQQQQDLDAVFSGHGLNLKHLRKHQVSAYEAQRAVW